MRPILLSDIESATQHVITLPEHERKQAVLNALWKAEAADRFRKRFRSAHPKWGRGSLSDLFQGESADVRGPIWDQPEEVSAIASVLAAIVDWRAIKSVSGRRRMICR